MMLVMSATPTLIALKKLANNQDTIWWVAKHVEALGAVDKPDWHESYKKWARCERMGAKEFTAAFPTWQYSIREFRARINVLIPETAGDGPTQGYAAMQNAILARLKNVAEV